MTFRNCVAVDLGASSGRVMLARYERECRSLTLREIHRFNNGLHSQNGYVTWNVDSLESAIRLGLNKVCEEGIRIDSIGIDTWGVDFVLLECARKGFVSIALGLIPGAWILCCSTNRVSVWACPLLIAIAAPMA